MHKPFGIKIKMLTVLRASTEPKLKAFRGLVLAMGIHKYREMKITESLKCRHFVLTLTLLTLCTVKGMSDKAYIWG